VWDCVGSGRRFWGASALELLLAQAEWHLSYVGGGTTYQVPAPAEERTPYESRSFAMAGLSSTYVCCWHCTLLLCHNACTSVPQQHHWQQHDATHVQLLCCLCCIVERDASVCQNLCG
jgi:hypothetical protein